MDVILVTGGAGYIGSHVCRALRSRGLMPVVFDNLSRGHREFAKWGPFEFGDIRNGARLDEVIEKHRPLAAIHLAAFAYVAESVSKPLEYYDNNVRGSLELLKALQRGGVSRLVFSSTCAVYGIPAAVPISEQTEPRPINPYGQTKLTVEKMIAAAGADGSLSYMILRYFNAAGADPSGEIGEWHEPEPHIIPSVIECVLRETPVKVFGNDYPTYDGTCIRDYVNVIDLASAHVNATEHLLKGNASNTLNLGTGKGYSVREIVDQVGRHLGTVPVIEYMPRRPGDPAELVASADRARSILGWTPQNSDLTNILSSAISWHRRMRACA
jgi:UDP-glucose-4-epimerase GalE